jgi:hypothetical protein
MKILWIGAGITLAMLGTLAGVAGGSQQHRSRTQTVRATKTIHVSSARRRRAPAALVSVNLAALGSSVIAPHGPYRARPTKIAFDFGGYYGAGTKGLWINHLRWFDWGKQIAYASGVVHARLWPSHRFITTAGGIMLDQPRAVRWRSLRDR